MKNLLESLTIEEKIRLLTGKGVWHTDTANGKLKSVLMMDGPQGLRLAPDSLESPAHGMNEEDLKKVEPTIMPSEFNLANTWDKDLVYLNGQTIAEDCIDFNVDILLAPGISIKRTPLCGRNFEYFSEDPYLAGEMGKAYVLGVQSKGVGTSLKHFCLNNREHDRFSLNSVCEERVMREIYFPAFKKTLEAKPYSIMSSYNRVNGRYMAENKELLDDLLKKEWGYDGLIVSDWGSTKHGDLSVLAGLDLCMSENENYINDVKRGLEEGRISIEDIDNRVLKILELIEKTNHKKPATFTKEDRHDNAIKIAKESFVLLKNEDNILPLKGGKILVGEWSNVVPVCGGGSALVDSHYLQEKYRELLKEKLKDNATISIPDTLYLERTIIGNQRSIYEKAKNNDVVILTVGNDSFNESESKDRDTLRLTHAMEQVIINTAKYNKNVIVLLYCGASVDVSRWIDKVKGVILVGFAGEGAHQALVDVLVGDSSPCGKLSETFPKSIEDAPAGYYEGDGFDDVYSEGLFVGYRYYDTNGISVAFPFGYGLSYAEFKYSNLKVEKATDKYILSYEIENLSNIDAKEISEIYVSELNPKVIRPKKELKAFDKRLIRAKSKEKIRVELGLDAFSYYSVEDKCFKINPGEFEILVGASVEDIRLKAKIIVD